MGGKHPQACIRSALRWAGLIVLALLSLGWAQPAPAAEYAEGARAFAAGNYARAVALWREAAWVNDDIDAQLQLADLYSHAKKKADGSYEARDLKYVPLDIVEAYVWTFLAVINRQRSSDTLGVLSSNLRTDLSTTRFKNYMPRLYTQMTAAERGEAERRITYILASRGAEGFYRLGEIYFGCPRLSATAPNVSETADQVLCRWPNISEESKKDFPSANVFAESPVDALAYFTMAGDLGHRHAPSAKAAIEKLVDGKTCHPTDPNYKKPDTALLGYTNYCKEIVDAAERQAELWEPSFEVYPKPYSDESRVDTLKEEALAHIGDNIKCEAFQTALRDLGFYRGGIDNDCGAATHKAMQRFQASIGGPVTQEFLPAHAVKLIRLAAINGFASSQFTLGYMYHYGYGVPVSYPRARTWFERAANQRHPYALYNLGILYRDGLGIAVDFGQAATYFMAADKAGYPNKAHIACRLEEVRWPAEGAKAKATCPPTPKGKPAGIGH